MVLIIAILTTTLICFAVMGERKYGQNSKWQKVDKDEINTIIFMNKRSQEEFKVIKNLTNAIRG
jgi:hypothetical protein